MINFLCFWTLNAFFELQDPENRIREVQLYILGGGPKAVDPPSLLKLDTYCWDNYKDYTYVGTLDGLYQHTLIATGTRLRPVEATFFGHILGTKPAKNIRVLRPFKTVLLVILSLQITKVSSSSSLGGQNASGPPSYIQVGPPGSDFRGPGAQKIEFKAQNHQKLIILGLLKFVKNSPTLSLWGV